MSLALSLLALSSVTIKASTVDDLVALTSDYTMIFEEITAKGTTKPTAGALYFDDHLLTPVSNTAAANKGNSTINTAEYLNCLRVKNAQDYIVFKVGGPCKITFYTQKHESRSVGLAASAITTYELTQPVNTDKWELDITDKVLEKFPGGVVYAMGNGGDFYIAGIEFKFDSKATPSFPTGLNDTYEVMAGLDLTLSAGAKDYTEIKWYEASSKTANPETDTELGTGDVYNFNKATEGTYYVYCRAYNANATGEKYAISNVATITVKSIVYPLYLTWDFSQETKNDYFTNTFAIQGGKGKVHSDVKGYDMDVDATVGKFSTQGRTSNAQFNAGTKLRVPVGSSNDIVTVKMYTPDMATVGGVNVPTAQEWEYRATKNDAENGYVEIVATAGGYVTLIKVMQTGDGKKEDREVELTYYDVDGETVLGTQKVNAGNAIGSFSKTANVPAGYTDNGWVSSIGATVTTETVVASDMVVYPYVTKLEDGKYIIPVGNGRQLFNTLKNAEAGAKFYLANGTYDMGTACRTELKDNQELLGESREGVKIVNHPTAPGIQATSTIRITGNNVYIEHLTLRCDVSYAESATSGVGVALEINGDKSICYDVDLQCNQDTYYSNVKDTYRGYFKDGRVEGTVDFFCGGGNMWFENTLVYCNGRSNADVITAPSTGAGCQYGYVFNNCTIDGDKTTQDGKFNLGRPWQNSPAATWLNTVCNIMPSAKGYTNMSKDLVLRFHEYNTKDANGTAITGHELTDCSPAAGSHDIYLTEIGDYTYDKVIKGSDSWDPETIIAEHNKTTAIEDVNVDGSHIGGNTGMYDLMGRKATQGNGMKVLNGRIIMITK